MKEYLKKYLEGKKILILGFGREGKSTLRLFSSIRINNLTISDKNDSAFSGNNIPENFQGKLISGDGYLDNLTDYDLIIKSPGIKLDPEVNDFNPQSITSQVDLFLAVYSKQTIGVTGTKGKSTTSSLIFHIIRSHFPDTVFGGNIGIPLFDLVDQIHPDTRIVCELSSHQLQYSKNAPHIGILLNLFQEHLDHYSSYLDYQKAKYNIALNQGREDYFIYNALDVNINALILGDTPPGILVPFMGKGNYARGICIADEAILLNNEVLLDKDFSLQLTGEHNYYNAILAAVAAHLSGVPLNGIKDAIATFKPLEHRLEFVGEYKKVKYYNDSISTIPEAAIAAVESIKPVHTLILGGFDRGIDYSPLTEYLKKGEVKNVVTTGPAGYRIFELNAENEMIEELFFINKFDEAVLKAIEITPAGGCVLLSPAASSYNEFINFEARGTRFKEIVSTHK